MFRIPTIQSTELKKLNKLQCPSQDTSVPNGRGKKTITRRREGEKRTEALRASRKNGNGQPREIGGWGYPPECTRDLGGESLRTQREGH